MAISEKKIKERKLKRNLILDAAEKIVLRDGLDSFRMDDIATMAEVSKGTLYLYFKNKVEIVMALLSRCCLSLNEHLAKTIAKPGLGMDLIRDMCNLFFQFTSENPHFLKYVIYMEGNGLNSIMALKGTETIHEMEECDIKTFGFIRRALQIGMYDGSIDPELDPDLVAVHLMFALRGHLQFYIMRDQGLFMMPDNKLRSISLESLFSDFFRLFSRSIEPRKK
ncbi:MAG: TetR/AcrR family transcriptional regulator [Balneolales bacterium]|nr:TetR/AcrR family transcriptional regulator [Balneolales bacterium]